MKLVSDNPANLAGTDHPAHLAEAGPHHIVRLPRLQPDILQPDLPLQAVKIIKGVPVPLGAEQFKLFLFRLDPRLFIEFPDNGLTAGLPCPGCTAGVFPGAGKALILGPSGQQQMSASVLNPDTDLQAVLAGLPGGTAGVGPSSQIPVLIIDIVEFHPLPSFHRILYTV